MSYPLNFLHQFWADTYEVLHPFLLMPDYAIDNAWYFRFLGFFLSLLTAKIGAYFLIDPKCISFKLAAKVIGFFGILELVLFILSFNHYPCEGALALYILTLVGCLLYATGNLTWITNFGDRFFQVEDTKEDQLSKY